MSCHLIISAGSLHGRPQGKFMGYGKDYTAEKVQLRRGCVEVREPDRATWKGVAEWWHPPHNWRRHLMGEDPHRVAGLDGSASFL